MARAVELAPDNADNRLELALARLQLPDENLKAAARESLLLLREDPARRVTATRGLLLDAIQRRGPADKIKLMAAELQEYPESTFAERILYLDVLRQTNDPRFTSALTRLQDQAKATPASLATLISWMNRNHLSLLALEYARALPREVLEQWPVPLALAESYSQLGDWQELENATANATWGPFDHLRRAFLTRSYRAQQKDVLAGREWAAAVKEVGTSQSRLLLMVRTLSDWRWDREIEELLWQAARHPETQRDALNALHQRYLQSGDTAGLYRTLSRLAELAPENLTLQNNLAQVSLLLNANPAQAQKTAAELHTRDPGNAAFTSTYAYSLFSKGEPRRAVEAMATLSPEQLTEPSSSAYYGIFLVAAGRAAEAKPYLETASSARLLPEETRLLHEARSAAEQ